jgi:hypothetical protein
VPCSIDLTFLRHRATRLRCRFLLSCLVVMLMTALDSMAWTSYMFAMFFGLMTIQFGQTNTQITLISRLYATNLLA